jgi:hypothetical protein
MNAHKMTPATISKAMLAPLTIPFTIAPRCWPSC